MAQRRVAGARAKEAARRDRLSNVRLNWNPRLGMDCTNRTRAGSYGSGITRGAADETPTFVASLKRSYTASQIAPAILPPRLQVVVYRATAVAKKHSA